MKIFQLNEFSLFLVTALAVSALGGSFSCHAQSDNQEVIDTGNGLVVRAKYDSLSEKWKDAVPREAYERIEPKPVFNVESELSQLLPSVESAIRYMDMLVANPALMSDVEFTDSQRSEYIEIRDKYLGDHKKLVNEQTLARDAKNNELLLEWYKKERTLNDDTLRQIRNVFVPVQVRHVTALDWSNGLPKLLTETAFGDILEIDEGQKQRIREKSEKLSKEIEEFVAAKRLEAAKLVADELTDLQHQRIVEFAGAETLNRLTGLPIENIWFQHYYPSDDELRSSQWKSRLDKAKGDSVWKVEMHKAPANGPDSREK